MSFNLTMAQAFGNVAGNIFTTSASSASQLMSNSWQEQIIRQSMYGMSMPPATAEKIERWVEAKAAKPVKMDTNMAWLDKRIDEMRVRL